MFSKTGQQFKIAAASYDPLDPISGYYVALRLDRCVVPIKEGELLVEDKPIYIVLEKNKDGSTNFKYATMHKPDVSNYIESTKWWKNYNEEGAITAYLTDNYSERYYANERKAEALEEKMAESDNIFVSIIVKNGKFIIENLVVDNEIY